MKSLVNKNIWLEPTKAVDSLHRLSRVHGLFSIRFEPQPRVWLNHSAPCEWSLLSTGRHGPSHRHVLRVTATGNQPTSCCGRQPTSTKQPYWNHQHSSTTQPTSTNHSLTLTNHHLPSVLLLLRRWKSTNSRARPKSASFNTPWRGWSHDITLGYNKGYSYDY